MGYELILGKVLYRQTTKKNFTVGCLNMRKAGRNGPDEEHPSARNHPRTHSTPRHNQTTSTFSPRLPVQLKDDGFTGTSPGRKTGAVLVDVQTWLEENVKVIAIKLLSSIPLSTLLSPTCLAIPLDHTWTFL